MSVTSKLDENELEMLRRVVALYIRTGHPVSSRVVKRFYRLSMSTANIRKILHGLEEKGFLYKPHISAGRVPSDLGYRAYVDGISKGVIGDRELLERIRLRLGQDWLDIKDLMARTSQLLSELTAYMGLIMGIFEPDATIESIRIFQLEGPLGLVVVNLSPGMERKVYIELGKRYRDEVIHGAELMINERIAGHSLTEAPEILTLFLREHEGEENEIVKVLAAEAEYLFEWGYDLKFYFKGMEQQIGLPEYKNTRILQNLIRIMGERSLMLDVMRHRLPHDELVTIGRENELEELSDFSIVTRRFVTGECSGLLGVLGPMRMSYSRVLYILDGMAEELHRVKIKG